MLLLAKKYIKKIKCQTICGIHKEHWTDRRKQSEREFLMMFIFFLHFMLIWWMSKWPQVSSADQCQLALVQVSYKLDFISIDVKLSICKPMQDLPNHFIRNIYLWNTWTYLQIWCYLLAGGWVNNTMWKRKVLKYGYLQNRNKKGNILPRKSKKASGEIKV